MVALARQDNFLDNTHNPNFHGRKVLNVCEDLDAYGEVRLNKLFILRQASAEAPVVHLLIRGK